MSVPLAYLCIVVIWSTTPLTIKWSGEEIGFLLGVSLRMMIAAAICLTVFMIMRWHLPRHKQAIHVYLAVGIPLFIAMNCVYLGAQYIPTGLVSVIFGLTPIFTGLFAALWLREKVFTLPRLFGVLMGIGGLVLIFHNSVNIGEGAAFGIVMVLAATITHSFGTVWTKYVINHLPPFTANTGGVTVSALLFAVALLFSHETLPHNIPLHVGGSIIYLAVFGSILGAVLFYYALRRVDATSMGMLTLITPVVALFLGKLFNGEALDSYTLAGTILILFGLLSYQWAASIRRFITKRLDHKVV